MFSEPLPVFFCRGLRGTVGCSKGVIDCFGIHSLSRHVNDGQYGENRGTWLCRDQFFAFAMRATIPAIANGRAMAPVIAAELLTIGTQLISTAMLESTRPVDPDGHALVHIDAAIELLFVQRLRGIIG